MENNEQSPQNDSFIGRYVISTQDYFKKDGYLNVSMRLSIFEKVLTKYLFQKTSPDFSLYPGIENMRDDVNQKQALVSCLNLCKEKFTEESPLYFFGELANEILRLIKEDDLSLLKFDKFILKIEFLLAWHFENNFLPKQIETKMQLGVYDNFHYQGGRTNYIFSIESINTIQNFLKVFEKQSLSTKIEDEFSLIRSLFCSEKIYYFYCDQLNREKIPSGNIVKYLLDQLNAKLDSMKNAKVNNSEMEGYLLINLFMISKIIQNFSFYFHKNPELMDIFQSIKNFKTFPFPIGILCNEILENLINEMSFQGITLFNKLRQMYFIDILDKNVSIIQTKHFGDTLILYSNEWERENAQTINTPEPQCFNLTKFLYRLKDKKKSPHSQNLVLREVMIKLLISFLFNSKENITEETIRKIYKSFMPNYKDLYIKNSENKENQDNEEDNEEDNEFKYKENPSQIKQSLDKIIKILDVGFDKTIEDFSQEINIVANKVANGVNETEESESDENILETRAFLPITSMRNYLKPHFNQIQKLYSLEDMENYQQTKQPLMNEEGQQINEESNPSLKSMADIFDYYIKSFKEVVHKYFPYLLGRSEDPLISENLYTLRRNFINNFRINVLLCEQNGTMEELIENMKLTFFDVLETKISDDDFVQFWKLFVRRKEDIIPKFLLYVVPYFSNSKLNPFRLLEENDELEKNESYLSEYIASNDCIYKNFVFMPFSFSSDPAFFSVIPNCQTKTLNILTHPNLDTFYSFLKKPLDYYLGDSNGIINLNLYSITFNENKINKIFWKNLEFSEESNDQSKQTKLTLVCCDYLNLDQKENVEITLTNSFDIKLFNLFFKKDVPFNYNMNSNNGWLEMFLDDKYNKAEVDKMCNYKNFLRLNNITKYYEEFNMPQTDLETRFKNYKVKKIILESNSPDIRIKYDDKYEIKYKDIIDVTSNSNNSSKKNIELKLKIIIEPLKINEENYCLPVASFISI